MKKIYLLAASASVALGLASCDIDDVENIGEMSAGNFPATETDALSMLAGVYQGLNNVMEDPQNSSFIYTALLASDDMLGGGGENDKLMQAVDLLCNYNADMTNNCFTKKYDVINRANGLLQAFGSASLADDVKNKMMGEALFLRAFNYYTLASMYGNVPVRTVPGSDVVPQGEITDVWKQILQDLRDAVKLLPAEKTTVAGRVDKYAAEAMLGRAWLFYAGMFCNGTSLQDMVSTSYNEDAITSVVLPDGSTLTKQDVISAIDDCVDNSSYSLNTDFRALWAYSNKCTKTDYDAFYPGIKDVTWAEDDNNVNPETLFAVKFSKFASWNTTIGYANGLALHLGVRGGQDYGNTFPFGQGWGAGPVAPNLVDDWKAAEPNDMRLDATVQDWRERDTYAKGGWGDFIQETDYYGKKLCPISAKNAEQKSGYSCTFENVMYPGNWGEAGAENMQLNNIHDLVLIRFADVLLMQSELKKDATGMNRVRERAGLPAKPYTLENLQNERRWELACEGLRWNDIRRWHIAADALERQSGVKIYVKGNESTNTAHSGGYRARYNATAGFMKMPDTQISMGVVAQNPGYDGADSEYQQW